MGLAPFAFEGGPGGQLARQRRCGAFGDAELGQQPIDLGREPGRGSRPPWPRVAAASCHRACIDVSRADGELVGRGLAAGLLLGLGGQPAGLRAELGEDVLDARQVRLGFDQLLLGVTPSPLVPPDAGDLVEQRASFLRSQGEGLVDHPLADEQEGVVGEVRGVEQVDQVAQPDAGLVEQVVVLARAIEAPAELEDLELDREQAVGVVDDQRDVGHPLRGPLLRSGPDDVLGLARAKRPALLAERPAQGVGEVALARPVGTRRPR